MSRRKSEPVVHRETIRELLGAMEARILSTMEERIQLAVARGRKEDRETYEAANAIEHAGFESRFDAIEARIAELERPVSTTLIPGGS